MGLEFSGSDLSHEYDEAMVEECRPNLHEKENGNVHSGNGIAESAKEEADNESNANIRKDAVDILPAEPQIRSVYIVRYRTFDDPILKAKIDHADKEIRMRNQQRLQILERLKAKRSERAQIIGKLHFLGAESTQYGHVLDEKINQIKPLKMALGSLRGSNNTGQEGTRLCSLDEKLNELIWSLSYRMQHEVIPLTGEKHIHREINQFEGSREKVTANAAMRAKIQDSLCQNAAIQDQVKLLGTDLDGVKDRQVVRSNIKLLKNELKAIGKDISSLQKELTSIIEKRDKAFETIKQLRKQRDEENACFYKNRSLLTNAKELAAKKDIKALEELAYSEVEEFMSSWNNSKPFRDDYEKRILASLDMRQLTRDGRIANINAKPLFLLEKTKPVEVEMLAKPAPEAVKEDVKPPKDEESVIAQKALKEPEKKQSEPAAEPEGVEEEIYFAVEKPKEENAIDESKLKEIRRQAEIEKQKLALERKKKLAEKTAAKAAIKAQKEAEKKQKEREKKLKKKESACGLPKDDADESYKAEEESKETCSKVWYRGLSKRRDNALAKAIMKRKKPYNYWVWAGIGGAALAVLLATLFVYLLRKT